MEFLGKRFTGNWLLWVLSWIGGLINAADQEKIYAVLGKPKGLRMSKHTGFVKEKN